MQAPINFPLRPRPCPGSLAAVSGGGGSSQLLPGASQSSREAGSNSRSRITSSRLREPAHSKIEQGDRLAESSTQTLVRCIGQQAALHTKSSCFPKWPSQPTSDGHHDRLGFLVGSNEVGQHVRHLALVPGVKKKGNKGGVRGCQVLGKEGPASVGGRDELCCSLRRHRVGGGLDLLRRRNRVEDRKLRLHMRPTHTPQHTAPHAHRTSRRSLSARPAACKGA